MASHRVIDMPTRNIWTQASYGREVSPCFSSSLGFLEQLLQPSRPSDNDRLNLTVGRTLVIAFTL